MRIACVQNGDFTAALRNWRSGGTETYNGQFYTVSAFMRFVADWPHLVISLDSLPHEVNAGNGHLTAIAAPRIPFRVPRRLPMLWQAKRILRRLEQFAPTHLLVRCVDLIGCSLLEWAIARGIPSAIIVAARFDTGHDVCRRFCQLANHPSVQFVGNHNRVATQSMLECGLDPAKAIAWDLPPSAEPAGRPVKRREAGTPLHLLFAGVISRGKGVHDLLAAVERSRQAGVDVRLTLCGDGALLDGVRRHAGIGQGWLEAPGRIDQQEVLERMSAADAVVVPSRAGFPEGLPFVIQEALAVRTPLILSDHPVFVRYFTDGHAVRFFRQADVDSLAATIGRMSSDTAEYTRLSQDTLDVWQSLQCPTKFHHLLEQLSSQWTLNQPAASAASLAV